MAMPLAEYPFTPKFLEVAGGHKMAYLDEGEGFPLVMVHGNPSWSYLYRNLVTGLLDNYRIIVPDHLGCGFSAKPQDYPYTLANHIANLETLLEHCNIKRCILVVHDWGGAIGMGWAGSHPQQIAGLVVLNTAAFPSHHIPWRIAVCRWPLLGPLLVRGLNGFAGAAVFMAVAKKMEAKIAQGFLAPYDSWANRVATLRFVQDIPMSKSHPTWPVLQDVAENLTYLAAKPMLICWGGRDFCFNDYFYAQWQSRFPKAQCHYFPDAGHYVLEDAGPEILGLLRQFCKDVAG